jgi:hypothetical protein
VGQNPHVESGKPGDVPFELIHVSGFRYRHEWEMELNTPIRYLSLPLDYSAAWAIHDSLHPVSINSIIAQLDTVVLPSEEANSEIRVRQVVPKLSGGTHNTVVVKPDLLLKTTFANRYVVPGANEDLYLGLIPTGFSPDFISCFEGRWYSMKRAERS